MTLKKIFGLKTGNQMQVDRKTSVKILAKDENKYLMLATNRGDLEFPGGKIEDGEKRECAVKRELLEETGYEVTGTLKYLGQIVSRRKDRFEAHKIYETLMYFYRCNVKYKTNDLALSAREKKFNPVPIILEKEVIIELNKKYASKNPRENVIGEITEFVLSNED